MKRVLTTLAAAGGASLLAIGVAAAQSLGGLPIREPGSSPVGGGSGGYGGGGRDEVIVSQSPDSKVRTVAEAMRLVKPGGTIIVRGGTYTENLVLTKAVSIQGVTGAYGRSVEFRPAGGQPCVTVDPGVEMAPIELRSVIVKFDSGLGFPCIDVHGGNFTLKDSLVIPENAEIPVRAAYGELMPELYDHIRDTQYDPPPANPKKAKKSKKAKQRENESRRQEYVARHSEAIGRAAGVERSAWSFATSGANLEQLHAQSALLGPAAGVRVAAGDVRLDGNVIIGATVGLSLENQNYAGITGSITNNVILGNGTGIQLTGLGSNNVLVNRNTIRYNRGAGIAADVYSGVTLGIRDNIKIVENEVSGNGRGIELSEKVRGATISANLVEGNLEHAFKLASTFRGDLSANTIAGNGGCTVQFFSAEQKIRNNVETKLTAYDDFEPLLAYAPTNYAANNEGDARRKKRRNAQPANSLAKCDAPLNILSYYQQGGTGDYR